MTKTKPKPKRTPEERRAEIVTLRDELAAYVEQETPEVLAAYVALFDGYSPRNAKLIGMQRPDATDVRGYREWLAYGRQVRKGERGVKILAPITRGNDDDELVACRVAHVFDVEQTDPIVEDVQTDGRL